MKLRIIALILAASVLAGCSGKKKGAFMLLPLASLTAPSGSGSPASASQAAGSACTQSSPGHSWGDPHLRTLDGMMYDFQGMGEYWLIKGSENDFGIQVRQEPWNGNNRVTVNTAVATQIDGHLISVYRNGSLYIDRTLRTIASGSTIAVGTGSVRLTGATYRFTYGDGSYFEVQRAGTYMNIVTTGLKISQTVAGLLGNCNGNFRDDLTPRDGSAAITVSFNNLYNVFGNSWRLRDLESWFEYGTGQAQGSFDGTPSKISPLDPAVAASAEQVCRAAGVTDPVILDACVLDVAMTGDESFAQAAASIPAPAADAADAYYELIAAITDNGSTGGSSGDDDDNGGSTGGSSGDDDDNGGSTGGSSGDDDDNGGSTGGSSGDDDDNGGRCKKGNSHASEKNHGVCSEYFIWGQKKKTL